MMLQEHIANRIVATVSGLIGGMYKAFSSVLISITIQGVLDVIVYAAISAITGLIFRDIYKYVKMRITKKKAKNEIVG